METANRTAKELSDAVAKEIRVLLVRRDMKQTELAAKLGVSEMWLSRRLRGAQELGLNDLQRIAEVLNVEPSDLLPREGRAVVVSGSTPRQTTVSYRPVTEQRRPIGQPKRTVPPASTRRPARLLHA